MKPPPESLAPSWLPRQQRRYVDRQLRKLIRPGVCSVCGSPLKHNSRTASGLDAQGNVAVAGECCSMRIVVTFGMGLFSGRHYDFLSPRENPSTSTEPTDGAKILDAIGTYQNAITETDKVVDGMGRRSGLEGRRLQAILSDHPWKTDDCVWFERNPTRSHRMRPAFPGELEQIAGYVPTGRATIMLVRQVEPGQRVRLPFDPDVILLPGSPNDEAFAHAMFDVAAGREPEPSDVMAFDALIQKYRLDGERGQ